MSILLRSDFCVLHRPRSITKFLLVLTVQQELFKVLLAALCIPPPCVLLSGYVLIINASVRKNV